MPTFAKIRVFLGNLFLSRPVDGDLNQEGHSHFEMLAEENIRSGMSANEARRAARVELGGIEQVKEKVREQSLGNCLHSVLSDCRFALRQLRKSPGVTASVVLTLAFGIGVNTAMFSLLNGWLLRPLPVPASEEITVLALQQKEAANFNFSYPDFLDFRQQANTFSDLFAYAFGIGGLSADGDAREIGYFCVSGNYFSGLGVKPVLGRLFFPGEGEKPGGELLVVLGYSFWQSKFGRNPDVVGTSVRVDGKQATIIGVAPKDFHGTQFALDIDVYLPLSAISLADASPSVWTHRGNRWLNVMGRLNRSVSLNQAQSSIDVIAARLATQYPQADKDVKVRVLPERRARPGAFVASFIPVIASLFLALAALVLLLACSNVANILLVRALARGREMTIRSVLGASRTRIIRQVMTESLILALLGSMAGVFIGAAALHWSGSYLHSVFTNSSNHSLSLDVSFDWRVFGYASIVAFCAAILVGLGPALRATRTDVNVDLREGRGSRSRFAGKYTMKDVPTVAQIACSLMLLVVAGLFVHSLNSAEHMNLGFNPDHVLNVILDPHEIGYDQTRTNAFYRELDERLRGIPGVRSTSLAFTVPMGFPSKTAPIFLQGRSASHNERPPMIPYDAISPSYIRTMEVPLLEGRAFTDSDDEKAPPVAIINQAMAKRFWPKEDPIGQRFSLSGAAGPFVEVIGMAGDGQYFFLTTQAQPYFYLPLAQSFTSYRCLQIRTATPPQWFISSVQQQIHKLAPDLPIDDIRTMLQLVHGLAGLFLFRLAASVAAILGVLGLTLATVGVYGLVSYSASQRTHEIGIRMALGATRQDVLTLVSRQGLRSIAIGIGIGLLAAYSLTRVMKNLLIGVGTADPMTFAGVAILLAFIALAACYIPARRATRVDPMVALRYE